MKEPTIESLYEQKFDFIFRYLCKIGCPKEEAEDIVQSTFFKAIEHMIHLSTDNPSAWLFQVATNAYYDYCRRENAYPSLKVERQFAERMEKEETDVADRLIAMESTEAIQATLRKMTPTYAHLLLLKYELDMSYEQIAQMLNRSVEYVRTNLYRARQQFKKEWREIK